MRRPGRSVPRRERSGRAKLKPLVLLACITGQGIREALKRCRRGGLYWAATQGRGPDAKPLAVEDLFVAAASEVLAEHPGLLAPLGLPGVLTLPFPILREVCHVAFGLSLKELRRKADALKGARRVAVLPFHPVLYQLELNQYVSPYDGRRVDELARESGFDIAQVISIHDDAYDVCRRLLDKLLFSPKMRRVRQVHEGRLRYHREPIRDLAQTLAVLHWRDRELSSSQELALEVGATHFLFHQKGPLTTFVKVATGKSRGVYFSHPISQPRMDLLGKRRPGKSETPNRDRGAKLQEACVEAANTLLQNEIPLVLPTAIDEYRIDDKWFEVHSERDLQDTILPPLTARWPNHSVETFGADQVHRDGTTPAPAGAFEGFHFGDEPLGSLKSAVKLVEEEIRRQINLRDRILAAQCGVVVAFRPWVHPDSPEPTGGVLAEIETVQRKMRLEKMLPSPCLIILHPHEDEERRRGLVFDRIWESLAKYFDSDEPNLIPLKSKLRNLLVRAKYSPDFEALRESVEGVLGVTGVHAKPDQTDSSMEEDPFGQARRARDRFVAELLECEILRSPVHIFAAAHPQHVLLLAEDHVTQNVLKHIKRALRSR